MALSNPETLSLECSELPDQVLFVGGVTLGENARDIMQQKTEKQKQKQRILMAAVALLNSGGGIVHAEISNENYSYLSDGIGLDIDKALKQLVSPSAVEDYFGFLQIRMTFFIFVKTWSSFGSRVRLCSIDTGLRIRSGTSALNVENNAVTEFLMKQKMKRNLAKGQGDEPVAKRRRFLSGDRPNGQQLFEREEVQLGEVLPFGESVNVELKSFSMEKNLFKRLKEIIPKYKSAFANTDGGYLFIGVDDKTRKVVGCGRGLEKNSIKTEVEVMCRKVISVHSSGCTQENVGSVEVRILNVLGGNVSDPLYVVAIHIPKSCCTVFEKHPDSWHLEGTEVCQIQAAVWMEKMQVTDPENMEFCAQFEKMLSQNAAPPKCKPVYGIKDDHLSSLQQKLFPVYEKKITITPDDLKKQLWKKYPNLQNFMPEDSQGVLILSNSWAVDIDRPKNKEVICEALLISQQDYPTLFLMVENGSSDLWEYAKDTAFHLKQKLVNLGGYSEWVCVIPQLVNCETGQLIPRQGSPDSVIEHQYPEYYKPENMEVVRALLQALVIVVMSFTSALCNQLGQEFFNLLTFEQFEILHSKYDVQDMRQLFVHGYPGTGKTVLATQAIRKIKNTFGCETSNILYICENTPLKEFIRKENICQSITRSCFVKEEFPEIKHIIVDEAQNFRQEGGWYEKAKQIVEPENGVFWVFLDYFQLSHTEDNGLPSPSRQTNKIILHESLRNSVTIHNEVCKKLDKIRESEFALEKDIKKHMEKMIRQKNCMHSFQGSYKTIIATKITILSRLTSLVEYLLRQGNSPKDLAILSSTWDDVSPYQRHLKMKIKCEIAPAQYIDKNVVVVDSVRRFSGLERNIVILINPAVHPVQGEIREHFLVSAISRARSQLYIILLK